jgi:hypothetical protein
MKNTTPNPQPLIHAQHVSVRPWGNEWAVEVSALKDNITRGDRYWVSVVFRTFAKRKDAETFARRQGWDG